MTRTDVIKTVRRLNNLKASQRLSAEERQSLTSACQRALLVLEAMPLLENA